MSDKNSSKSGLEFDDANDTRFDVASSKATHVKTPVSNEVYHAKEGGWKKGNPGRPVGSKNRYSMKAARAVAAKIIEDPKYLEALHQAAIARTIDANIEKMLWHYTYGAPPNKLEVTHNKEQDTRAELEGMSDEELAARGRAAAERMLGARARLQAALPAPADYVDGEVVPERENVEVH